MTVTTIPAGLPFVDVLADGIGRRLADRPDGFADVTVFLPTRRACRALEEAFLRRRGGQPMLLPRMEPLGDPDEDEIFSETFNDAITAPAISPLRRLLLLARLVSGFEGPSARPDRAARLAGELARLLDHVQAEHLSFAQLADLVPESLSVHWQETLEFLGLLSDNWPAILAAEGMLDPVARRNQLLAARTKAWRATPPKGWVIAAGSTGSQPDTADFLACVAQLPDGVLVLPGLDRTADDASWAALDITHPQWTMARLLERLGVDRSEVADWPGCDSPPSSTGRRRLVNQVLRPAATTHAWRDLEDIPPGSLDGLERLVCPGPKEEALAVAMMMRGVLEAPGQTAALVTPDRTLARRVKAELGRWNIEIDDSAGTALNQTEAGTFLRLAGALVEQEFAPVPLLAALKHPLAAAGMAVGSFRAAVRRLEIGVLRGPRPAPGLSGLAAAGADAAMMTRLQEVFTPFAEMMHGTARPPGELLRAHVAAAEALAASDEETGAQRLWRGEAGEAVARFIAELDETIDVLEPLRGRLYPDLLDAVMAGRVVRPSYGRHPRLFIWGPLEARLQSADLLILGGLNEGCWPPSTTPNLWMSRPMAAQFGLPLPERRIGLSAHDFAQAFCAPRVVLSRSERIAGAPSVPSRWLLRLDTLLRGLGAEAAQDVDQERWLHWQEMLDTPRDFARSSPPQPRPPLSARPRELSVTQVETWMRDPYGIYARHILKLRALDPLDDDPGAAAYGRLIHHILDAFMRAHPPPRQLPKNAEERLLEMGRSVFGEALAKPGIWAFWWPRFERIAAWFIDQETGLRANGLARSLTETDGRLDIDAPGGKFTISARADRLDLMADGSLAVIDYKTGNIPKQREMAAGFSPQLPLEGAIALAGGFEGLPAVTVAKLEYWQLKGGKKAGDRRCAKQSEKLIRDSYDGLHRLINAYDIAQTPYPARPRPDVAPPYDDYEHLARVREWSTAESGENE